MLLWWPEKDPGEVVDMGLDWTSRITGTETISTSTWAILPVTATPLVSVTSSISGNITYTWLDNGLVGTTYSVTNTIVTSGGRTLVQTVRVACESR